MGKPCCARMLAFLHHQLFNMHLLSLLHVHRWCSSSSSSSECQKQIPRPVSDWNPKGFCAFQVWQLNRSLVWLWRHRTGCSRKQVAAPPGHTLQALPLTSTCSAWRATQTNPGYWMCGEVASTTSRAFPNTSCWPSTCCLSPSVGWVSYICTGNGTDCQPIGLSEQTAGEEAQAAARLPEGLNTDEEHISLERSPLDWDGATLGRHDCLSRSKQVSTFGGK